jgi:Protein of unknown function (DUF1570)
MGGPSDRKEFNSYRASTKPPAPRIELAGTSRTMDSFPFPGYLTMPRGDGRIFVQPIAPRSIPPRAALHPKGVAMQVLSLVVGTSRLRKDAGRAFLLSSLSLFLTALGFSPCSAQETERFLVKDSRDITMEEFDFDLEQGDYSPQAGNVLTTDDDGRGCVAKIHLRVGKNFIVLLPDGSLVARNADKAEPTDREFVAATHDEIADNIMADQLKGFNVHKTERFVFVYNTTPEFVKVTATVLESMLTGVMELCKENGLNVVEPDIPLPVIMFHRYEQFNNYSPKPPGVAAYYEIKTNRVVLHQDSSLAEFSTELAKQELLSTIAHEGAHQILHNIGVQQRLSRWPMWIGEGIAEYMAPTKPGHRFAWKGAGKMNDLRMWELEGFLQCQFVKGFDGDTVDQTVHAGMLDSTGYASAWTITHFLAENRKEDFYRYMRYLSRMPPMQGMVPGAGEMENYNPENGPPKVPGNMVHFKKFFGEDIKAFENEMVNYMTKQKYEAPFGILPHFVGLATIPAIEGEKKHACFYITEREVSQWHEAVIESLTEYEKEHVQFEFYKTPNRGEANKLIKKWKKDK